MKERIYKRFQWPRLEGRNPAETLLPWAASHFDTLLFLNSNEYADDRYASLPWAIAAGVHSEFLPTSEAVFDGLKSFADQGDDWLFGFFSYEIKNQLEELSSTNPDHIGMPLCHFFQPQLMILPGDGGILIGLLPGHGDFRTPEEVLESISLFEPPPDKRTPPVNAIRARVSKERYLQQLAAIKAHIQAGDIYEMNYCIEFYSEDATMDPVRVYQELNAMSEAPFSCFYRLKDKYLLCASPERFMKKQGTKIISQPIKGTSARGKDPGEDQRLQQALYNDGKERSENVMIVDLVRNDLSRTASKGSVKVEELFGIYPFRQVNQMISTVTSELDPRYHYLDAIKNAFPMGSMTGAPKIKAMQLIEAYEDTARGLYSGAVGYISPTGNFDFNVVIRSILYNAKSRYLSFMAGSAITIGSEPLKEYDECLLKARAMGKAVGGEQ